MPNPGSRAALALGCRCPVLDNHHGQGMPGGRFWISGDCMLHTRRGASKPSREEGKTLEEGNQAVGGAGDDTPGADVAQVGCPTCGANHTPQQCARKRKSTNNDFWDWYCRA